MTVQRRARRGAKIAAGAAVALGFVSAIAGVVGVPQAEAVGDATVVVPGGVLPADARSQLTVLGCADVFAQTPESPAPMIGVVPGAGPAGKRSIAFDPAGGNAIGPVSYVESLATQTVAGMAVHAEQGGTGVAYVGFQAPDAVGTSVLWIGRAAVSAPAGTWTTVDAAALSYTWTPYDLGLRAPVGPAAGTARIPAFLATHGGDGYGFYAMGFGCDGHPFNTDAWRIGRPGATLTYDFEGYAVTVAGGGDRTVAPGDAATLTARIGSAYAGVPSRAKVVLERRDADGDWSPVGTARRGPDVAVAVRPSATTAYRFKVYSTPMIEGGQTAPFTVRVVETDPTEGPSASPSSSPTASAQPSATSSATSGAGSGAPDASDGARVAPSTRASSAPARPAKASATPSETATAAPTETPTAAQSQTPAEAPGATPAG